MTTTTPPTPPITTPLLSGALAGLTVDLTLYPLDTLKTRLQSSSGFLSSGGFRGVYKGLGSVAVGSAPGGALFFVFYEGTKIRLEKRKTEFGEGGENERSRGWEHMLAASVGEVAACAVRVPTEVVKQRAQAVQAASSAAALRQILDRRRTQGWGVVWRELYRGWGITVVREVPFTAIQFPLWEALKGWGVRRRVMARRDEGSGAERMVGEGAKREGREATAVESAVFGCVSGGVAAAATTPLDVLKTRVMLAREKVRLSTLTGQILRDEGARAFYRGLGPRVAWISIGGAVFLGSYQWAWNLLGAVV